MKANELRVGNIVKYAKDVYNFAGQQTEVGDIIQYETDYYEPIQLTEEWLLKFGFEVKVGGRFGNEYHLDNFILYTSEKKSICFVWDEFILDIYFVHDLQNLYNCLKRKELTIKTK